MSNFVLPPVGFGPGSQPLGDEDAQLEYMPMPQDMRTYAPHVPDVAGDADQAMALLAEVGEACAQVARGLSFFFRALFSIYFIVYGSSPYLLLLFCPITVGWCVRRPRGPAASLCHSR